MNHKSGCLICGEDLVYLKKTELLKCSYCRELHNSDVHCTDNHYVCDKCHSLPALDLIEQYTVNNRGEDPIESATALMRHPGVKMHGPEHHFLVPAVLLSAYYNTTEEDDLRKKIRQARTRAEKIPGGFCGSHGNCGAAVGTGIFISLITEATPLSKEEWRLSNLMTSKSLLQIANSGGPRCCKRDSFIAIKEAVQFVNEHFNSKISIPQCIMCDFSSYNKECMENDCQFYVAKPALRL